MIQIDPTQNTPLDNYKFLVGSVIPRPVAFVTTVSQTGVLNAAPFSFFNVVSSSPPMISLSIQRSLGKQKDTARNILKTGEFVVHIVDEQNIGQVNQTAANLPPEESEVALANFTPIESVKISTCGVAEAKIRMECILEKSLELGEGEDISCDFIIGKVVQFHIQEDIYEQGRINPHGLGAVSRLAGNNYAKIGEIFELKRPV